MDSWVVRLEGGKREDAAKRRRVSRADRILAPFTEAQNRAKGKQREGGQLYVRTERAGACSHAPSEEGPDGKEEDIRRAVLGSLHSSLNPITHAPSRFVRDTAVVSTATGHQVADRGGGGKEGGVTRQYWRSRHVKLAFQASEEHGQESQILRGVVAYINGYTGPLIGDLELKHLIYRHGGKVRYVLSQRVCTHVITAMPLSASKTQKEVTRRKVGSHGAPVYVRPEWILDSVRAGRRLAEAKYPIVQNHTMARMYDTLTVPNVHPEGSAIDTRLCADDDTQDGIELNKVAEGLLDSSSEFEALIWPSSIDESLLTPRTPSAS